MKVRVEFYGIARQRAGVDRLEVALADGEATLTIILRQIGETFPGFGKHCLDGGCLHPSLAANLDGERFVTDPETIVRDGQSLLILSADAGG